MLFMHNNRVPVGVIKALRDHSHLYWQDPLYSCVGFDGVTATNDHMTPTWHQCLCSFEPNPRASSSDKYHFTIEVIQGVGHIRGLGSRMKPVHTYMPCVKCVYVD